LIALVAIEVFGEVRSIAGRRALRATAADRAIFVFDSTGVAANVSLPDAGTIRVDLDRARALRVDDLDIAFFEFDSIGIQTKRCGGSRSSATASAAAAAWRIAIGPIIRVDVRIDVSSGCRSART
jgi:hypothetical protein